MRYGDCPICGKGILYEGGAYCSPDCWAYAAKPSQKAQPEEPANPPEEPPKAQEEPGPPPTVEAPVPPPRRWAPVAKKKAVASTPEPLPSLETDDDPFCSGFLCLT